MKKLLATLLAGACLAPAVHAAETPESVTTVSGGFAYVPEYMGANKSRVVPVIAIDYQNKNGFFASASRGLGYQAETGAISWSAAVAYQGQREEKRRSFLSGSDALKGMGEVKGGAVAKLGAAYNLGGVEVGAEAELALNRRERGNNVSFNATLPLLTSKDDQFSLSGAAKYADAKQMKTYFGVTPAQSARSGYAVYTPKAGISEISVGGNWTHVFDPNWSMRTVVGITRLASDAAKSPLTKRANTPFLVSTVNYSF